MFSRLRNRISHTEVNVAPAANSNKSGSLSANYIAPLSVLKCGEADTSLACSAKTQDEIDTQVIALIKQQHEKATEILTQNRQKLDLLAQHLYEKETITGEEFMQILLS